MRRPAAVLGVCLLAILAGCSLGGTGPTASTSTPTTLDTTPPGIDADGRLTGADALLSTHTDQLTTAGFVTEVRTQATVSRTGGPTDVERRQVVRVAPGGSEYNNSVYNPGSRFDIWGNESMRAIRLRTSDGVRYDSGDPRSPAQLAGATLLSRYLSADGWTVTNTTTEQGATLYTLRSNVVPETPAAVPEGASDVREYGAVVVVDGDGRVRYFEATGTYTLDGEDGSFTVTQRLVSTGDPGVDRPAWVDKAL